MKWQVELGSAANIARQGVTVKTVTAGTVVTVTFYPQRNGANQGAIAGPLVLCGTDDASGRVHASDRHRHEAASELAASFGRAPRLR